MAADTPGTSFAVAVQSRGIKRDRNYDGDSESEDDDVKKPKVSGGYLASGLKSSLHGNIYQLKLLTLFAKRGLQQNYGVKLATEMVDAEKFDDVVFYHTNEHNEKMIRFLQAKHKQDETKTITYSDLLSEAETDFSLKKYFVSYRKIQKNPEFRGYKFKDFVICTNIDFDKSVTGFEQITGKDDILHFENCSKVLKRLKLDKSEFFKMSELRSILIRTSEVYRLARILAVCVRDKKPLELRDDLLKAYHVALGEKVIKHISGKDVCQFRKEFTVDGKSAELENFRKAFYEEYLSVSKRKMDEKEFWKDMKSVQLKISKSFWGKGNQQHVKLHLPDDCINVTDINNFFDDLVFAVNQPNETELGDIIKNEIGEYFNLIDSEMMASKLQENMLSWMKCIEGEIAPFLNETGFEKFFNEIKQKIYKLEMIGPTLTHQGKVDEFKISFSENLTDLQKFLKLTSEHACICNLVCTHNTIFGSIKVLKILKELDTYQREDSYIFMRLRAILCLQDRVIETFNSTNTNLLIIECKTQENSGRLMKLYIKLRNVIFGKNNNKKVMLITLENDVFAEWFKNDEDCSYTEIKDEKNSLTHLDKKSQEEILMRKKIIFQDKETNLGAVVDGESTHLLSGDVLWMLIRNEKIEIGKAPIDSAHIEVEDYFIDRTFFRNIIIETDFHKREDFFIVDDTKPVTKSINESHKEIVSISDTSEVFEELCRKYTQCNIHWIKKEGGHFIWQQTRGDLKELRKFVDDRESSVKTCKPNQITDIPDRVVLLAGEPSMGKSVILSHLALMTRSISPSVWIIRSNLNDYTKNFLKWSENNTKIDVLEAMKCLCEIANFRNFKYSEENEQTRNQIHRSLITEENIEIHPTETMKGLSLLEIKLFVHYFHRGKILLLFDGFDEISPHYKDIVIQLLTIFKNETKVEKIWLTTRPYDLRDELESKFNTFSYAMMPFVEKEKSDFLKKFWRKNLKLGELDERKANVFIDELLNQYSKSTNDKQVTFLSTPLQIYMIATVFSGKFEKFYRSSDSGESSLLKNKHIPVLVEIDLVALYDEFLDEKFRVQQMKLHCDYDRYRSQPEGRGDIEKKCAKYREKHEILAVYSIFTADQLKKNLCENELRKTNKSIEDIRKTEMKTGIISGIVDHKPQFIHLTFAEYLVASYIWKKFISIRPDEFENSFIPNIIADILIKDAKIQVTVFLQLIAKKKANSKDDFFERKSKMHFLVKELGNHVGKCEYNISFFAEVLSPQFNPPEDEKLFQETILKYVAKANFRIIKLLLGIIEFSFPKRDENYNSEIDPNQSLELLCICAELGYTKLAQKLMENLSTENFQLHLSRVMWWRSPLWIAARNYHLDIVKSLVENSSYCVGWKDTRGAILIERALQYLRFDVLKSCLELRILGCGLTRNLDNKNGEFELPIYKALEIHSPPEMIKLLIENTDADLVNRFIHPKHKVPLCDIMIAMLLPYYDRPVEIIEIAMRKGFDLSFSMNDCFLKFSVACFEILIRECLRYAYGIRTAFVSYKYNYDLHFDLLFDKDKFSNLFSIIELLLKSGVGYSYSDKSSEWVISTYSLVRTINYVHKFLNHLYKLHKQKIGENSVPRRIILKFFIDYITSIGFKGVKIVTSPDSISILPLYKDELPMPCRKRICEIIYNLIENETSGSSGCLRNFKYNINSNDHILTASYRSAKIKWYTNSPFPYEVMTELFFQLYINGDGNLVKSALDKLNHLRILKECSKTRLKQAFISLLTLKFEFLIFHDLELRTEADYVNLLTDDIQENEQNKSLNKLVKDLLVGVFLLHFCQGYQIVDAVNEISEEVLKFENGMNKLLKMKENLRCEEDMILDYDNILEILDLKHIDCENEDLQYLTREFDSNPLIMDFLVDIYKKLNFVGQKNLMKVFEQMLKFSDQSTLIFELYELLHESYASLIRAVVSNNAYLVSSELKNVKQDFVRAVINGFDNECGSPLHYATFNGQAEIFSILLENGANPNLRLCNNAEKLVYFPEAVQKMKKNPFLPNNFINWTPLYFAVLNDHREIVLELINYGAVVNPVLNHHSQDGYTPLHISALTCGHSEIARLLLENGALYNVQNAEGKTPLDLATDGSDIYNLICHIDRMFQTVKNGEEDAVNSLFEEMKVDWKAILNARNTDGKTLLNLARDNKKEDIVELLLEKSRSIA